MYNENVFYFTVLLFSLSHFIFYTNSDYTQSSHAQAHPILLFFFLRETRTTVLNIYIYIYIT